MTLMDAVDGTPQFKFGSGERQTPQTIQGISPVDAFICGYTDGEGKTQTRICFRMKGSKGGSQLFIVQERVSGSLVVAPAHKWFNTKFVEKLETEVGPKSV